MSHEEEESLRWQIDAGAERLRQQDARENAESLWRIANEKGGHWVQRAEEAERAAEPQRLYNRITGEWELLTDYLEDQQRGYLEEMVERSIEDNSGNISDAELGDLTAQVQEWPQYWTAAVNRYLNGEGRLTPEVIRDLRRLVESCGVPWSGSDGSSRGGQ